MIVETNDEVALLKEYPDCEHVLCTCYLPQNLQHYLQAKIGISVVLASALTDVAFILLDAKDRSEFETKEENLIRIS